MKNYKKLIMQLLETIDDEKHLRYLYILMTQMKSRH